MESKQQLTIRLYCQIPHGSSAFNTVWPSNTHIFARSSLVSPVQTAISSNPAEYFRFKRACLLDLHPALFPLLAPECLLKEFTVASWPFRSWKLEWHELQTMGIFPFSHVPITYLTYVQMRRKWKQHLDNIVITQSLSLYMSSLWPTSHCISAKSPHPDNRLFVKSVVTLRHSATSV